MPSVTTNQSTYHANLRPNQVNDSSFKDFAIMVIRNNDNPEVCNYCWPYSTATRPPGSPPGIGSGFRYFPGSGEVEIFDF